jgi:dnd system-associated protein 4
LAVAETGQLEVLAPERAEERAMIFEEYAHTGLRELERRCYEDEGDPLQALIGLTESARATDAGELSGLAPNVLKELLR